MNKKEKYHNEIILDCSEFFSKLLYQSAILQDFYQRTENVQISRELIFETLRDLSITLLSTGQSDEPPIKRGGKNKP